MKLQRKGIGIEFQKRDNAADRGEPAQHTEEVKLALTGQGAHGYNGHRHVTNRVKGYRVGLTTL